MMYFVKDWKWIKLCLNWIPETMLCSLYCIKKPVHLLQFSFLQRCIKKTLKSPCQIVFLCRIWWVFLGRKFSILQTFLNPTSPLFTYRRLCVCVCVLYTFRDLWIWARHICQSSPPQHLCFSTIYLNNIASVCVDRQQKCSVSCCKSLCNAATDASQKGEGYPQLKYIQVFRLFSVYECTCVCVCVCTGCSEGELTNWLSVFY